jgi:Brp/Blh family beta-carotene 15,15'-monooxygenase
VNASGHTHARDRLAPGGRRWDRRPGSSGPWPRRRHRLPGRGQAAAGPGVRPAHAPALAPADLPPSLWAWPGYVVLGLGVALRLAAPQLVIEGRYVPLVASLVLCGLPHGAVDHLLPGWVRARPLSRRAMAALLGGYVLTALAVLLLWLTSPLVAAGLFFLVTVVHWGASELVWFAPQRRPWSFALARGVVPVILPALAFPGRFSHALDALLGPFLTHPPDVSVTGWIRALALIAVALICLAGAGDSRRARLELAGLAGFFLLVDPVFAVGLYFIAWHSWRHIIRLSTVDPAASLQLARRRPARAIHTVIVAALPCTLIALAGLGGFAALLAIHITAAAQVTSVALALIAALTIPHAIIVAWLDAHTQGGARLWPAWPGS